MAHALACRPETIPDARPDDLNHRVIALFERGLVPWVLPWRLAVTPAGVRLSEDVGGKDACYPELDLP